jgi:hypothetical protein
MFHKKNNAYWLFLVLKDHEDLLPAPLLLMLPCPSGCLLDKDILLIVLVHLQTFERS